MSGLINRIIIAISKRALLDNVKNPLFQTTKFMNQSGARVRIHSEKADLDWTVKDNAE
jgi:hypothetical protein